MPRWRLLLFSVLLAVLVSVRGQDDFSLGDALLEETTKKPLVTPKTPQSDPDDFDLFHALNPDEPKPPPPTNPRDTDNPKRDHPKGSDTLSDLDLLDGDLPKGGSDGSGSNAQYEDDHWNQAAVMVILGVVLVVLRMGLIIIPMCITAILLFPDQKRKGPTPKNGQEDEASQGAIAGIVSAVAATVIGAVSSFIAYQKKKLCFKQSADEENVNMDSHRGAQSEPPVQRTLLEN